jgi:hypothetical protein
MRAIVSAELVVRVVRPLTVSREERWNDAAPAVVVHVFDVDAGLLGVGAKPGDLVVLYSEALGDERRFRWLLRRGRRARFRALVETPRAERTLPALREFGGHPL